MKYKASHACTWSIYAFDIVFMWAFIFFQSMWYAPFWIFCYCLQRIKKTYYFISLKYCLPQSIYYSVLWNVIKLYYVEEAITSFFKIIQFVVLYLFCLSLLQTSPSTPRLTACRRRFSFAVCSCHQQTAGSCICFSDSCTRCPTMMSYCCMTRSSRVTWWVSHAWPGE